MPWSAPWSAGRSTASPQPRRLAAGHCGCRAIDRVPPANSLDALLAVIYLIFNEVHVATRGDTLIRQELIADATWLGRVLVSLLPSSAEAHGLLALMLLHDSRREARLNAASTLVTFDEHDRSRWD